MRHGAQPIGLIGASGFVGSHIMAWSRHQRQEISPVVVPHINAIAHASVQEAVDRWCRTWPDAFEQLQRNFQSFTTVINAAGSASPGSRSQAALFASNAVLPALVGRAAHAANVRRLVHVSSAAVQGRIDPLDETPNHQPLSPYAETKAAAERYLLGPADNGGDLPPEVIVYRPASVFGVGQPATQALGRLITRSPTVPVVGAGDQMLPVSLIQNVAAGIVFAAMMPKYVPIIAQPSENITTRTLLEYFGVRHMTHLSPAAAHGFLRCLNRLSAGNPGFMARTRWVELLLRGQLIEAKALVTANFAAPAGPEAWQELCTITRRSATD